MMAHELVLGDAVGPGGVGTGGRRRHATRPVRDRAARERPTRHRRRCACCSSPGSSAIVDYQVPADGELLLLCHLPGHIEQGMVGRVELRNAIEPVGTLAAAVPCAG